MVWNHFVPYNHIIVLNHCLTSLERCVAVPSQCLPKAFIQLCSLPRSKQQWSTNKIMYISTPWNHWNREYMGI